MPVSSRSAVERLGGDQRDALAGLRRGRPVVLALDAVAGLGADARRPERGARRGRRLMAICSTMLRSRSQRTGQRPAARGVDERAEQRELRRRRRSASRRATARRAGTGGSRSSIASIVPSGAHAVATRPSPSASHRLVVEGVDLRRAGRRAARAARERAAIRTACTGWRGELGLAVALEVLVQRAAAGDVERLRAAADPEQRHPGGVGGARQLELEAVERGLGRAELPRGRGRRRRRGRGRGRRTGRRRRGASSSVASPLARAAAARRARRRPARSRACRSGPSAISCCGGSP